MARPPSSGFPRPVVEGDQFYRAISSDYLKPNGSISPGAFCNTTGTNKMSVDWAERSTPPQTLARLLHWQGRRGVASIEAIVFWDAGQSIEWTPLVPGNEAHTDVVGSDSPSIRKKMARNAELVHEVFC